MAVDVVRVRLATYTQHGRNRKAYNGRLVDDVIANIAEH
tara:strand:+ start:741 stop:857 length:117 start_codon:yes stop_codon:yes gene_type:complete